MQKAGDTPMWIGQDEGPTPGTSREAGDGYIPADEHPNINDDILDTPNAPSPPSNKRKIGDTDTDSPVRYNPDRFKNKKPKYQEEGEKRSKFLESISESLSSVASFVKPQEADQSEDVYDLGWAKLLVPKLRQMTPAVKAKYKVHVDSLALQAIDNEWP